MTDIDAVYREYFTDVYRYLMSLCRNESLAEELTQDTFFRAEKPGSLQGRMRRVHLAVPDRQKRVLYVSEEAPAAAA